MSDRAKELIRRYTTLKGGRSQFENHWDELARVMLPGRVGFTTDTVPGEKRTEDIFDGTPMQAARGLSNAIEGMIWPEGQKNFFIKAGDDQGGDADEAKEWFSAVEDRMLAAMNNPKARLRQSRGEMSADLVVLGNGVMFVGERQKLNGLLYQSVHLKDAVVIFSEEGTAEGLLRCKTLTLRQAEARFGLAHLSEETQRKIGERKYDDPIRFLHAVVPRKEGRADAMLAKNLPFASLWIEVAAAKEVEEGGFHEFPFVVARWDTSSGEDYGRSPGMIALPDSNTLQAMGETILIAGQRAADPPLLAPNDGFFDEANAFPGGITYYDAQIAKDLGKIPIGPLESATNLPISRDMQQDTRQQVFAAFFRNVLNLPVEGPQMTATEVMQRKEEFIREIGPVFGRLETDYTGPLVERTFQIMLRAGAFPTIPEALLGKSIRFEYESPVKKIRQQVEAAAARLWVGERIEIATATNDPSALDLVDFDEYARFSAEAAQVPHKIVAGKTAVEEKRRNRAKQQQMMQQAQAASTAVDIAARAKDIPGVKQAVEGAAA